MTVSTESLLTSPRAFGVTTATPAQRGICRILDGLPLAELATHVDVTSLIGGHESLAEYQRGYLAAAQHGAVAVPSEVIILASIRSAKTIIACAAAIRATQTVDVSRLGPGEVPRVSIVSLKLDVSAVARRILGETLRASPLLRALIVDDSGDIITVRHPSGRHIEIACVFGGRAGGGLIARWCATVIFDEAPRMTGAADGSVVNLDDARAAVLGRMLPGAQILYIGSAWAPFGPIYDLVQEHWGKPTADMIVLRGTGPMLNPREWTEQRCAKLQEQNHTAYRTDVLGEFADPESGLLSPDAIQRNERQSPVELPREDFAMYVAAVDPSEGGAGGNGFSLCIVQVVQRDTSMPPKYRVVLAREWRGLRPEQVWKEISDVCASYGVRRAWTDQYAATANQDLARRYAIDLEVDKTTASSKLESFTSLATLIHSDAVELPPLPQFRRDLLSVRKRVTQTGMTIVLGRSAGRHADLASCFCLAMAHATTGVVTVPQFYRAAEAITSSLTREDNSILAPRVYFGRPGTVTHDFLTGERIRLTGAEKRRRRYSGL